jgi:hypothetical protein
LSHYRHTVQKLGVYILIYLSLFLSLKLDLNATMKKIFQIYKKYLLLNFFEIIINSQNTQKIKTITKKLIKNSNLEKIFNLYIFEKKS